MERRERQYKKRAMKGKTYIPMLLRAFYENRLGNHIGQLGNTPQKTHVRKKQPTDAPNSLNTKLADFPHIKANDLQTTNIKLV